MAKTTSEFEFLKKARFWSMVLAGAALFLFKDGYISEALMVFLTTVSGGFTLINTLDRNIDRLNS
jgi:4-hydroxybenzoate polyprenyltransferase